MQGLKVISVIDALVASLRDRVLDGELQPGRGLTETEVADEYAVSRPTAKAAIVQLVADGLLRREAHKTAYVPQLGNADVVDLFLVRTPLELEVVRRLAMAKVDVPRAREAVRQLATTPVQAAHSEFIDADLGFHRALVAALKSPRLSRMYDSLTGEMHLYMVQSRWALGRDRIVTEHGAILDAVLAGDTERAVAAMRDHLGGAETALLEHLENG